MNSQFRLLLIVTALFVAGVGRVRSAYAAPPAKACSLLTAAQVSAVLGVPVRPPVAPGPKRWDCIWVELGAPPRGKGKGVMLDILGALGPKLTPMDRFNAAKKGGPFRGTPTTISGVGGDAVYVTDPLPGDITLYVKKGGSAFKIIVVGFPPEQIKAKEKTLALDVLKNL
jgi:hypothetical protein